MERIKKILLRLIFLNGWLLAPLVLAATVLLVYVFANGLENTPVAYAAYALSAYALAATACRLPDLIKKIRKILHGNPHSKRYITEADHRARVSLYSGLCIHLIYSFFKIVSGIYYSSVWFGAEAAYHIIISIIQFLMVRSERKNSQNALKEWSVYRVCGVLMLLLNIAISAFVFMTVFQNKSYVYSGVIIYATAAYTFYRLIISFVQIGKFRKRSHPILSASKFLNLSASLMSLFALQTAMLTQFGGENINQKVLNSFTGIFVCFSVIYIAVSMIIRSTKEIRTIK